LLPLHFDELVSLPGKVLLKIFLLLELVPQSGGLLLEGIEIALIGNNIGKVSKIEAVFIFYDFELIEGNLRRARAFPLCRFSETFMGTPKNIPSKVAK
jgi:hypothetical protein